MKQVHVLVEGQSEEEFVREILNEYLNPKGLYLNAILAKTKRAIGANPAHKGGIVSYGKIESDLKSLLRDSSVDLVTTMIDLYHLPSDFPAMQDDEAKRGDSFQKAAHLEAAMAKSIAHPKFLPYLAIHEFEALLFSDTAQIVRQVRGEDKENEEKLLKIRQSFESPEEINLQDPPSKRLLAILKEYNKVQHGYLIAIEIGVETMRKACSHFNQWLEKLENLDSPR